MYRVMHFGYQSYYIQCHEWNTLVCPLYNSYFDIRPLYDYYFDLRRARVWRANNRFEQCQVYDKTLNYSRLSDDIKWQYKL